ncbi:hypothetical protein QQ045_016343 [Rhodiola kirilowii]
MLIEAVPVAGVTDQPPNALDNVSLETICAKLESIDQMLDQHLAVQKESQKQVATSVIDEKWLEEKIALAVHKAFEANSEALLARFQEENDKNEKVMKECMNKIKEMTTGLLNKAQSMAEKTAEEVTDTIISTLEEILYSSLMEAFQEWEIKWRIKLEKSVNAKLKATVARQIQAQFQTSRKQSLEASAPSSSSPSQFEPSDSINEQDVQSDNLSLETKELLLNLLQFVHVSADRFEAKMK